MAQFIEKKRTAFLGLPIYFTTYTIGEELLQIKSVYPSQPPLLQIYSASFYVSRPHREPILWPEWYFYVSRPHREPILWPPRQIFP